MPEVPLVPHFDLPFRRIASTVAVVEQDSPEDVINCVEAALRTEKGSRTDLPTFGITDPLFQQAPVDVIGITNEVIANESRAALVLTQTQSTIDSLITTIQAEVSLRGETHG